MVATTYFRKHQSISKHTTWNTFVHMYLQFEMQKLTCDESAIRKPAATPLWNEGHAVIFAGVSKLFELRSTVVFLEKHKILSTRPFSTKNDRN